jgi:hypothetical protein
MWRFKNGAKEFGPMIRADLIAYAEKGYVAPGSILVSPEGYETAAEEVDWLSHIDLRKNIHTAPVEPVKGRLTLKSLIAFVAFGVAIKWFWKGVWAIWFGIDR